MKFFCATSQWVFNSSLGYCFVRLLVLWRIHFSCQRTISPQRANWFTGSKGKDYTSLVALMVLPICMHLNGMSSIKGSTISLEKWLCRSTIMWSSNGMYVDCTQHRPDELVLLKKMEVWSELHQPEMLIHLKYCWGLDTN